MLTLKSIVIILLILFLILLALLIALALIAGVVLLVCTLLGVSLFKKKPAQEPVAETAVEEAKE